MKRYTLYGLFGLLLVAAGVSGCADGGVVARRQESSSRRAEPRSEAAASELVAIPAKPTLVTLAKGDDLSVQISDASGPVLLDFFATWCGPCQIQSRILHETETMAAERGMRIVKVDVDKHPQIAQKFQIASLPTLLMIKDGKVVQRQSGVTDKESLLAWME